MRRCYSGGLRCNTSRASNLTDYLTIKPEHSNANIAIWRQIEVDQILFSVDTAYTYRSTFLQEHLTCNPHNFFNGTTMDRPELYNGIKSMPTTSATEILNQYSSLINWRKTNDSVMDLGCGDGRVTSILKSHIPGKDTKVHATDINENMIRFAREKYAEESIEFKVFDVQGDLPDDWKSGFNHVFSFLMLQFVRNQEKAFQNIFDLLSEGGDCLLTILRTMPCYEVVLQAAQEPKWSFTWIRDPFKFISPYYLMQNPDEAVAKMMEDIGFSNVDVKSKKMLHVMQNGMEFKNFLKSVEPFKLPDEVFEELTQDSISTAQNIGILDKSEMRFEDRVLPVDFNYEILLVYATKPKKL